MGTDALRGWRNHVSAHGSPDLAEPTLLYMYTPDLTALREQLLAAGINVPPISYPHYMLSGEITLHDPDGAKIFVGHWGKTEHDAWLERIGQKPKD